MDCRCDPLAFTTALNTLAAALTQLGDTLATIAAQRQLCGRECLPGKAESTERIR